MLRTYAPILLFILIATAFGVFALLVSRLVQTEKPDTVRLQPYGCGMEPLTDPRDRYSVRFIVCNACAWRKGALDWQ
jgi:NADH-quinone oxidoreductase subunit A